MQAPHKILGKKLLVITAHPDDESYVMAGTLAANAKAGGQSMIVCATAGEKGASHLTRAIPARTLAQRRKQELHAACSVLHVNHVCICNLPDGRLAQRMPAFSREITKAIQSYTPDIVVSFGPCGITGHADHIAAGKVGQGIAKKLGVPFAAAVLSPKLQRAAKAFLQSRRKTGHYKNTVRFVEPNLTIRIAARDKRRALRCHASQMDAGKLFTGFPKYIVEGLLHHEYFRIWKIR
ncbi:MAG: PIG-L family deacetylase [Patescibacteria group bacterium]